MESEIDLFEIFKNTDFAPGWGDFKNDPSVENILNRISLNINRDFPTKDIAPIPENIFAAFELTPANCVKVVLMGQDPYPGKDSDGQPKAQGFSFSVRKYDSNGHLVPIPHSLKNIYKEIKNEYPEWTIPNHGDLTNWALQGVLLLNSSLTCNLGIPDSHKNVGWSFFLNKVMKYISVNSPKAIYVLWGKKSQEVVDKIGIKIYKKLESNHPSFSAVGFFGNNHFKIINRILVKNNIQPIVW